MIRGESWGTAKRIFLSAKSREEEGYVIGGALEGGAWEGATTRGENGKGQYCSG